jgi:hypothetical protein
VEALVAAAASSGAPLPLDIKFMLEGQEEILSPHLRSPLIRDWALTALHPGPPALLKVAQPHTHMTLSAPREGGMGRVACPGLDMTASAYWAEQHR